MHHEVEQYLLLGEMKHTCSSTPIPVNVIALADMKERHPHTVCHTRRPCTNKCDKRMVRIACCNNIPEESYNFLAIMIFGARSSTIQGERLHTKVNDSDCNEDRFSALWDTELLEIIVTNDDKIRNMCF